jgi:hypothetical protein
VSVLLLARCCREGRQTLYTPACLLLIAAALAGCATEGGYESRPAPVPREAQPSPAPSPGKLPTTPAPDAPLALPQRAPYPGNREGQARVDRLLPRQIADRAGWAADIFAAFAALRIPPTPDNICAAVSVIANRNRASRPILRFPAWRASSGRNSTRRREKYAICRKLVLDLRCASHHRTAAVTRRASTPCAPKSR